MHASSKTDVVLELLPEASWLTWIHPVKEVDSLPDGRLRVVMEVVNDSWFGGLLLSLGTDVISVDPSSARDVAVREAQRALVLYGDSADDR